MERFAVIFRWKMTKAIFLSYVVIIIIIIYSMVDYVGEITFIYVLCLFFLCVCACVCVVLVVVVVVVLVVVVVVIKGSILLSTGFAYIFYNLQHDLYCFNLIIYFQLIYD